VVEKYVIYGDDTDHLLFATDQHSRLPHNTSEMAQPSGHSDGPKHKNIGKAQKFRTMALVGNLYRGQDKDTVFGISSNQRNV